MGTLSSVSGSGATGIGGMYVGMVDNGIVIRNVGVSGDYSTALGAGAQIIGTQSLALGAASTVNANNAVALGALAVADRDNSVSVGSAGHERQIANVKAGTADTDAVNVGQLNSAVGDIADTVKYDDASHSKLTLDGDSVTVTREVDGGLQTVTLKAPAIITTDLRLNEPRYASLPNIMKAKKKPIEEKAPDAYGVDITPRLQVLKTSEPPGRKSGAKVGSVAELVGKLKNEAGVL